MQYAHYTNSEVISKLIKRKAEFQTIVWQSFEIVHETLEKNECHSHSHFRDMLVSFLGIFISFTESFIIQILYNFEIFEKKS